MCRGILQEKCERKNPSLQKRAKGQALIETLLFAALLILMIGPMTFRLSARLTERLWIHHSLYEGLVLHLEGSSANQAERWIAANINRRLTWGRIESAKVETRVGRSGFQFANATVRWCTNRRLPCRREDQRKFHREVSERRLLAF